MLEQAGFKVERLILDGFDRHRLRPLYRRSRVVRRLLELLLALVFPTDEAVHRLDSRVGSLLFSPIELTALARRT